MTRTCPIGSDHYSRVVEWLYEEARLMDAGRHGDWLALLADDISYRMPVRQALHVRDGDGFDDETGFFVENRSSLGTRVDRLGTDQAWSDQPVSRTRHLLSNILVDVIEDGFAARCSFMVTRIRSDMPYDLFTGERRDVLRDTPGGLRLASRTILLDQTVLKSHNLSIFF